MCCGRPSVSLARGRFAQGLVAGWKPHCVIWSSLGPLPPGTIVQSLHTVNSAHWDPKSMPLSLRYNLKNQELAFGKVASDSKNILAQGEICSADERIGDQVLEGSKIPLVPPEPQHLFYFMWHHCHFLTLMAGLFNEYLIMTGHSSLRSFSVPAPASPK